MERFVFHQCLSGGKSNRNISSDLLYSRSIGCYRRTGFLFAISRSSRLAIKQFPLCSGRGTGRAVFVSRQMDSPIRRRFTAGCIDRRRAAAGGPPPPAAGVMKDLRRGGCNKNINVKYLPNVPDHPALGFERGRIVSLSPDRGSRFCSSSSLQFDTATCHGSDLYEMDGKNPTAKYSALLEPVVNALQSIALDVVKASQHVKRILQLLKSHRDNPERVTDEIIKDATVVAEKVGLEEDITSMPRIVGKQRHRSNHPAESPS
ncbi:hypothetical protein EVAR_45613_1 [Eumeta japonica]|uniref:Uncharacterized protein n=1 Tax=Eumeta variegata TaxID=151549 RepID=A0A4C1WGN1_EUMVA|nr:hypothetical protein EVAR_45613_1 [Eumeta japonica]